MRMLTASTKEIDEPELAVEEILEQLDLPGNLMSQSVGILSTHPGFLETGVCKAISEALPFSVIGITTLGNATRDSAGFMQLVLSVFTGDDVYFSTALSEQLSVDNLEAPLKSAYDEALSNLQGSPKLMIALFPLLKDVGVEQAVTALDRVSGGVPQFGTVANDHTGDYSESSTIYHWEAQEKSMVMLLISGNIAPHFYVASISDANVQKQKAVVTKSQGSLLQEVNNMPMLEYVKTLGLSRGDGIEGMSSVPFMVDYGEGGKPIALAIYTITEEGYAVCGGAMPEGATIAIGSLEMQDVLDTSKAITAEALQTAGQGGMLLYPCLSRNLALGTDVYTEMEQVMQIIGGDIPYQFCYAGGEICPVYGDGGGLHNHFHNFTMVICTL